VLTAAAVDLLSLSASALSEPLFILLALAGLVVLAAHLQRPRPGLLLGAAAHDGYSCSDGGFCMTAAGGGLLGGMLGTAVGSIIGLMYGPSEHWQLGETLSGIRAAPGQDGSVRVGISIMR